MLAGPLKDIPRLVPKPFLCCLRCVLRVVVLLVGEPSPQSEVLRALEQVVIKDLSVLYKIENCWMPSLRMTNTIRETFVSMGSTGAKSLETRDGWVFVGAGYMNGQSPLKKYMKHNFETNVYDGWPGVMEMGGCILRNSRERGIRWLHGRVPLQS
uniref:Uncharacterized protein n=1 Tax=Oncorhynchus kisutch TaxID=8019 RepID=A0A8C7I0K2_ONCKI